MKEIMREELKSLKEGTVLLAPSRPEGIDFLSKYNAWGFVRIRETRSPQYFALYISSPESRIMFFGEIKEIVTVGDPRSPISTEKTRQYGMRIEGKKIVVLKPNSLKKLKKGIQRGVKKGKMQGIRYVTLNQFIRAKTIDDL